MTKRGQPEAADFLLALLNSTPTIDGAVQDQLADEAAARSWIAKHGEGEGSREDVVVLRTIRDALQRVLAEGAPPRDLAPAIQGVSYRPVLDDDGLTWHLSAPADRELAARAVIEWDGVRRTAPNRLRACKNEECTLFFLDRSKNNSARWCSMSSCGNRMKARRHYERHKNTATPN